MAMHALGTLGAIILAAIFFSVPLVLKYHVYKPEMKRVTTGDVEVVEGPFSTVWCQEVELQSDSNYKSFLYESDPEVDEEISERMIATQRIVLPNKAQKYLRFHLLQGSKVNMSSCARLSGAGVSVVKGHHELQNCLEEHRIYLSTDEDISGEDSQSESESDDVTSSISSSQGAVTNDSDRPYFCKNSLHDAQLPSTYKCNSKYYETFRKFTLLHNIEETDYYYYVFSSHTYLDILPNDFSIEFVIDRTHYAYETSINNCSSDSQCRLGMPLASQRRIVVQMEGFNGTLKDKELKIICKP
ncbi:hypothetical protein X975_11672, partial [Stegodyphus mimosarum]